MNGTKVNSLSESQYFHNLVTHKTAQIGSTQGNTRSKATYNRVGIFISNCLVEFKVLG